MTDIRHQRVYTRRILAAMEQHVNRRDQALISETEKLLDSWKHPDPYIPPTAPGGTSLYNAQANFRVNVLTTTGSKYERNLPCPVLDRESTPMRTPSDPGTKLTDSSAIFGSQPPLNSSCRVNWEAKGLCSGSLRAVYLAIEPKPSLQGRAVHRFRFHVTNCPTAPSAQTSDGSAFAQHIAHPYP